MFEPNWHPADVRLIASWRELATAAGLHLVDDLGAALFVAYSKPHRLYHGRGHIAFLLDEIERCSEIIEDKFLLGFAAWFHDAVYDPVAKDNEEQSADWARKDLVVCGYETAGAEAVATLVLKTKSHHSGDASPDEALFLDMDFAILGAPPDVYASYADNIRAEYAFVPEDAFRKGRDVFLKSVLAQPQMFRTDLYEAERGAQARANIAWEIARLGA